MYLEIKKCIFTPLHIAGEIPAIDMLSTVSEDTNHLTSRSVSLWAEKSLNESTMIPALEQSYTYIDGLPIHVCKSYTDKGIYCV